MKYRLGLIGRPGNKFSHMPSDESNRIGESSCLWLNRGMNVKCA